MPTMNFSGCPDDDSFGPAVHMCRDDFDFTIRFEKIFFSLVPTSIFIAIALARVVFLLGRPEIVRGSLFLGLKLTAAIVYSILQLSILILSAILDRSNVLLVSTAAVLFAAALCIVAVSFLEHARSPRPSILLSVYLFITLLFDIVQIRTSWLASFNDDDIILSRLFTTSVAFKLFLILLECQHKSRWLQWDAKKHSPEETTGIFGLGTFFWLNRVFLAGNRKIITLADLSPLDQSMATEALQLTLMDYMKAPGHKAQKHGLGLAKALAKTLVAPLLLPVGPRVALTAFKFCQPFLINTLLSFLQRPKDESAKNIGYGLIGAAILVYTGIAFSTALYWYFQERVMCMSRGCLAGAVYRKTTEVKLSAANDSAALTLMSADVERIRLGFLNLHEFWANVIEVGLASWLVERQLGAAFAAPLVLVLCCTIAASFVNRFTAQRQKAWMSKIQKRVGMTANAISNMKHLKISGLTAPVENLIQNMRIDELKASSGFRKIYITVDTLGYTPLALTPVLAFAVTARTLDINTIFTSVAFLLLLADPLTYIFQNSPNFLAAFACLDRIQTFLENDPRVDFRVSEPDGSEKHPEKESLRFETRGYNSGSAMNISSGNFGWEKDKFSLKDIDLDIPARRLTIVVGPVASGKSTFCKALLGEVPVSQAQFSMNSCFVSSKVGYCGQNPYLLSASIRENIVRFAPFNPTRYREVIEATMLTPDLSLLPKGDETPIGSNGIVLSGGQKQRVSVARALYSDSNFFIFDDILSGLDADTEDEVFRRVFGPDGVLRRRNATTVLCTHSVRHLPSANHIVVLGAGGIVVEQGTFLSLVANNRYIHSLGINPTDEVRVANKITRVEAEESGRSEVDRVPIAEIVASSHVDEKARMVGDSTVYRYYLESLGTRSIIAFTFFGLGWGFFYNWGNVWLQYWSNDVTSAHPLHSNWFYVGLYAVWQLSYLGSMFFVYMICYTTMIQVSGARLHKAALSTMINAPLRFFSTTDTGLIINLFSQDMTLIDNELPIAVTNLALDIWNALGMAAVIASSSPFLAIAYAPLFTILYGVQKFYLRTSRQLRLLDLEAKSPLYTHFLDTIKDIATFRSFGWVQDGIDTNNRLLDTSQRPTYLLAMVQRWLGLALQLIVAVLAVAVVTLATQLRSSTGLTGASLVTLITFGDILNYIIRWWTQIETSIGAITRLKGFSEIVRSENLAGDHVVPPRDWPLRGHIEVSGVSASYENTQDLQPGSTGTGSLPNLALRDLNLSIQPGEKVAICGRSGSGKSSTILLLLRLLDPVPSCSENITIDSIPLHKIDRSALRQRIIAIPQEPVFLTDGTSFMENLDPFNKSTEVDCRAVLEAVDLWPLVNQRGGLLGGLSADALSQGQKQLFSLARALLRRRIRTLEYEAEFGSADGATGGGILLLDEVSSSVDQETDKAMQRVIKEEFKKYTIVMVSHRLDVVMDFDTVIVMDKGSVTESGPPRMLVETEGSHFKALWQIGNKD